MRGLTIISALFLTTFHDRALNGSFQDSFTNNTSILQPSVFSGSFAIAYPMPQNVVTASLAYLGQSTLNGTMKSFHKFVQICLGNILRDMVDPVLTVPVANFFKSSLLDVSKKLDRAAAIGQEEDAARVKETEGTWKGAYYEKQLIWKAAMLRKAAKVVKFASNASSGAWTVTVTVLCRGSLEPIYPGWFKKPFANP